MKVGAVAPHKILLYNYIRLNWKPIPTHSRNGSTRLANAREEEMGEDVVVDYGEYGVAIWSRTQGQQARNLARQEGLEGEREREAFA